MRRALALIALLGVASCDRDGSPPPTVQFKGGADAVRALKNPHPQQPPATFRDCDDCPVVVALAGETFVMGIDAAVLDRRATPDGARSLFGAPRHEVAVRAFAVGRTEVTRGEFAAFVRETGHAAVAGCIARSEAGFAFDPRADWRNPGFAQDDRHPVVCVSAGDAAVFARWLSTRTGAAYRLPSEAEWEFAARPLSRFADTEREYSCAYANAADQAARRGLPGGARLSVSECSDGFVHTAPAGRFTPSERGLHDMMGNAWEWTADCWHDSYDGAPGDGSAWTEPNCPRRVARGGAWSAPLPSYFRYGTNYRLGADGARSDLGFRVVRSLD